MLGKYVCRGTDWPLFTISFGMGAFYDLAFFHCIFEREVGSRLSGGHLNAFATVLAFSSIRNPLSTYLGGRGVGRGGSRGGSAPAGSVSEWVLGVCVD